MTAIGLQWFSFRFHRCHSRFPKVSHLPSPPMARLPQVRGLTKQRFGTASRVSRPDTRWARRRGTLRAASLTVGSCAFGSGASLARWPFECLVRLCRGLRGPGREKSRRSQTARRGEVLAESCSWTSACPKQRFHPAEMFFSFSGLKFSKRAHFEKLEPVQCRAFRGTTMN